MVTSSFSVSDLLPAVGSAVCVIGDLEIAECVTDQGYRLLAFCLNHLYIVVIILVNTS